jgi:glycosyltransferase involved in cell wall biosynthesis
MSFKNLSTLSHNQRPEKNYPSRIIRRIVSVAPFIRFVSSSKRPLGISVIMRVKDEADWIKVSVRSIKGLADEIIIVDNGSTDGTYNILKKLAAEEVGFIKLWYKPDLDMCALSNFALAQTTFRWVFRWDGDMVAHTSGQYSIHHLRERIFSLNSRRYYLIYLRHINLAGDLFHQDPQEMVHVEEYIHSFSDKARFVHPHRFETVKFPKYYIPLHWYEPYGFHINVKPAKRMLLRYFWEDWMQLKDYALYPTLEDYVNSMIKKEFSTNSWQAAQQFCVQKICQNFVPYDCENLSPYPDLLQPYLKVPRYRLKYEDGKLIGRDER